MKYIITSGPMEMHIDSVRTIENSSSGVLAATMAKELSKQGYTDIVYIHTPKAVKPDNCKCIEISDHKQLIQALEAEIESDSVIVHAMAISDFKMAGSIELDKLSQVIFENRNSLTSASSVEQLIYKHISYEDKLSSSSDQILLFEKEIKVIDQIKKINKDAKLVGFKLLSNVSKDELISVGKKIMKRADCDLVVCNIKEQVSKDSHIAQIIANDQVIEAKTKVEIAKVIIKLMEEQCV